MQGVQLALLVACHGGWIFHADEALLFSSDLPVSTPM
jgi:hypothetical protein